MLIWSLIRNSLEILGWEVGGVGDGSKVRDERSLDVSDRRPVDSVEELEGREEEKETVSWVERERPGEERREVEGSENERDAT